MERHLCSFAAFLAGEGLKHRSVKTYLSAVRHLQISMGLGDPFGAGASFPRLEYVLRGVKRVEARKEGANKQRLPITPSILAQLRDVWAPQGHTWEIRLIWAASTLCFFAFLRAGEMTTPTRSSYDPQVHLCYRDIAFNDPLAPTVMEVTLKQSKTDPFRKGVKLAVGRVTSRLCPVAAMLRFLAVRGSSPGPLFTFQDGSFLSRERFVLMVRAALQKAGIKEHDYCGHSFRIGAATTAARKGVEDSIIKTLGRWESVAYLQYVRIPREQLAGYAQVLAD